MYNLLLYKVYIYFVKLELQLLNKQITQQTNGKNYVYLERFLVVLMRFIILSKVREKQNVYEVFFLPFLFFISKTHNMKWKKLTLVFDENVSFSFYGSSKFFRFGDFEHFFQNFKIF
jgi:hypothetical protein